MNSKGLSRPIIKCAIAIPNSNTYGDTTQSVKSITPAIWKLSSVSMTTTLSELQSQWISPDENVEDYRKKYKRCHIYSNLGHKHYHPSSGLGRLLV